MLYTTVSHVDVMRQGSWRGLYSVDRNVPVFLTNYLKWNTSTMCVCVECLSMVCVTAEPAGRDRCPTLGVILPPEISALRGRGSRLGEAKRVREDAET